MILENPVGCSKIRRLKKFSMFSVSRRCFVTFSSMGQWCLLEAPAKDLFFFCSDCFLKMACDTHTYTHTKRERTINVTLEKFFD